MNGPTTPGVGEGRPALRRGSARRRNPGSLLFALATALLLALVQGPSPAVRSAAAADPLATLKPGHWVQLEGSIQADSTILCDELRVLTGDFLDDDWALRGIVRATDKSNHEIVIGGVRIQVMENTGFDSPNDAFRSFSDLKTGSLLEVEGAYLKGRRLIAREVDDESDEVARKPWAPNRIRIVAKVERFDPRNRLVTAMGFVFRLTDKTRIRSVIE